MKLVKHLLAAITLCAAYQSYAQNKDQQPYLVKDFDLGGQGNLKVETSDGNITVTGQQGEQARVEMYVRGNSSKDELTKEEIKEKLEDYEVQIKKEGTTVYAISKRKSSGWSGDNGVSISFKVYMPQKSASDLETSGGNINLSNLEGTQEVETSGGTISLNSVKGNSHLETSGGNIDIEDFSGNLNAETSGGNIKIGSATGELKVETSGGNIKIASVSGSVIAETSGGNISAQFKNLGKYLTLSTSSGNIQASIPLNKGLDIDLEGDKVNGNFQNFKGSMEKDKVKGKINGGGIPVKMSTSGGNISLN